MMALSNPAWVLKRRPHKQSSSGDLDFIDLPVPDLADNEVLIRTIYLSLDPTNRVWMSDRDQYLPPVGIGDVMRGVTIGIVEQSRSDRFSVGDIVQPSDGKWQLYTVTTAFSISRVRSLPGVPLTAYLSVLGTTGLTAYFGLLDVCQPRPGEMLAITAAAGAVGSIVGQIAKIKGVNVVGVAGGTAKCRWIVDDLGFDGAIDYKTEDVGLALDRLCPNGIDMGFENVGGDIMDAVFSRLNRAGRLALCGMIANYNDEGPMAGPNDFGRILMNRLTVRGFIVIDYISQWKSAMTDLSTWVSEGKLKWKDHVVVGLENAPAALQLLFNGNHDGKLLVQVSPAS